MLTACIGRAESSGPLVWIGLVARLAVVCSSRPLFSSRFAVASCNMKQFSISMKLLGVRDGRQAPGFARQVA